MLRRDRWHPVHGFVRVNAFDRRCRSCLALLTFAFGSCILATEMRSIFEVSAVRFAAVALVGIRTALPSYRGKFSKHVFSQPLAVACLTRYEDRTSHRVMIRLVEHGKLQIVSGLHKAGDHARLHRFMRRLVSKPSRRGLGRDTQTPTCGWATCSRDQRRPWWWSRPGKPRSQSAPFTYNVPETKLTSLCLSANDRSCSAWSITLWALVLPSGAYQGLTPGDRHRALLGDTVHAVTPLDPILADVEFGNQRDYRRVHERLRATSVIPVEQGEEA